MVDRFTSLGSLHEPIRPAWRPWFEAHLQEVSAPTDAYWLARFEELDRKNLTHDLGNLSLTKDNSSYCNKPFPEKKGSPGLGKPCYAESPFFMERELAKVDDWDPGSVRARRERLVEWALKRWRVPDEVAEDVQAVPADQEDPADAELEADGVWG